MMDRETPNFPENNDAGIPDAYTTQEMVAYVPENNDAYTTQEMAAVAPETQTQRVPGERFTMKDIGGLDQVPGTMEYQERVTREALEKQATIADLTERAKRAAEKFRNENAA